MMGTRHNSTAVAAAPRRLPCTLLYALLGALLGGGAAGCSGGGGSSIFTNTRTEGQPSTDAGAPNPMATNGGNGGGGNGGAASSGSGDAGNTAADSNPDASMDPMGTGGDQAGGGAASSSTSAQGTVTDACGGCDDDDPCTEDTCQGGQCQYSPVVGVVHDGFTASLNVQAVTGTTLVAGPERFYLAIQGQTGPNQTGAQLFSVGTTGTGLQQGPQLSAIAGGRDILAPVGMATTSAGEFQLQVFAPIPGDDATGDDATNGVLPLVFDAQLAQVGTATQTIAASAEDRFRLLSPTVGVRASTLSSGEPFVVWPSGAGLTNYRYDPTLGVSVITPQAVDEELLGLDSVSLGDREGIVYATRLDSGETQLYFSVRDPADTRAPSVSPLPRCVPNGELLRVNAAALPGTNIISILWSEQLADGFVTNAANLECDGTTCGSAVTCGTVSGSGSASALVQADSQFFLRGADAGAVYRAQALSVLTELATVISVSVDRLDVEARERTTVGGDNGSTLAISSIDSDRNPLHFVEVEVIAEKTILATWVKHTTGVPDVVALERYQICY